MANLNYKIKILVCINLLFSIVFIGLAALIPSTMLKKNEEEKFMYAMVLHFLISLFHLSFSCPIMCSSTSCAEDMSGDERINMNGVCNSCLKCKDMA